MMEGGQEYNGNGAGEQEQQNFTDDQANYEQAGYEQEAESGGGEATGALSNPGDKINASKNDDDERKIFVGGLSWETTVKDLKDYFSAFGQVADCVIKQDPETGRSRGFGFVQFTSSDALEKVLAQQHHSLHGKTIDPKKAKARGGREPVKKVFVGGLDPEVPESDIREHFSKFGKIEEIDLPFDKVKGQRRAFCFITFESEAVVDNVVAQNKQYLAGKEVDVKKATPKSDRSGYDGGYGYGRGGGRGGRGGWGGEQRGGYNQGGWGNQSYGYGGGNDYYGQGYGGGYDYYNQGYGGGYDYSNYYNQGWGNYNQGYGGTPGYGQGQGQQQGAGAGGSGGYKAKGGARGGGSGGSAAGYHPYSR